MANQIKVQLLDDGCIRLDSRGAEGSETEIMKELKALAATVGGELEVERHEPGKHVHSHEPSKVRGTT